MAAVWDSCYIGRSVDLPFAKGKEENWIRYSHELFDSLNVLCMIALSALYFLVLILYIIGLGQQITIHKLYFEQIFIPSPISYCKIRC